jgi:hypothetical protein
MGQNKYTPGQRKYSKRNFVELIELLTPEVYQQEDLDLSGTELNPISEIINTHLVLANNIQSVIPLSSVANSTQTSALGTIQGIAKYFIKQADQTKVSPILFETNILNPLNQSLTNFDTSSEFCSYLSSTLLPIIVPPSPTNPDPIQANAGTLSAIAGNADASSIHEKLIDTLGWFYFLNTSADGGLTYSPSSYVLESLCTLYTGNTLKTNDGIKGLSEYIWKNYATCSLFSDLGLIPGTFVSGAADAITEVSAGILPTYTSGVQKLDNLKTLLDVIYSPLYIDERDYRVQNAFNDYIDSTLVLEDRISKGPIRKLNTALGFKFADISDMVENLDLIYDIENTTPEQLQYIAQLIGWRLRGHSPEKWRHQLRLAVDLYKKSGTLEAIQVAINALITDSVFDVSGQVQELWESYLPFLIWYSLGTESPLFKNLETWTPNLAAQVDVPYSTSSLEENLKLVTDSILLDLYKKHPKNFIFDGEEMPISKLYELDKDGKIVDLYTVVGDLNQRPFHAHLVNGPGYAVFEREATRNNELTVWEASKSYGPLGYAIYMAGESHPATGRPIYLSATGDPEFVFNYRQKIHYPIPPFEEVKYFKDCAITADLVSTLIERLKCYLVDATYASELSDYLLSSAVETDTSLGSLNGFLMLFSSVQIPPNFDAVMLNSSNYQKNLLNLWNGKSSHLFVEFDNTDFDFAKTTLEGDGRYALYEAARVTREFSPAHAIPRVNLNASAEEFFPMSSTKFEYLGFDKDDDLSYYTSASILGNLEVSGASMSFAGGGGDGGQDSDGGRGGLNTFKRPSVDEITDTLISGTAAIITAPRRALRRRNYKYVLPKEGYYDRTGFNGPVTFDPSSQEYSFPSSLGELTLGYVASAGKFHPVENPLEPTGVWNICESLNSSRTFSGIDSSATFPYRGLSSLGSNAKMPEVPEANAKYNDRGQLPLIYNTMHELYELKTKYYAQQQIDSWELSSYSTQIPWKNVLQSYTNQLIASGYALNSFDDYVNFEFGSGLHRLHRDYCKYFNRHGLALAELEKTGGNIFSQVFGKGLYNCDFSIEGSAVSTELLGSYICSSVLETTSIGYTNGSGVFSTCAVAAYSDGTADLPASGTYIASSLGDAVVPLTGSFVLEGAGCAEFRNPHILSGVEFCDASGSKSSFFQIFKLDKSFAKVKEENFLIENTVIKCKSKAGLPRLRFDLSSYGDRRNYFIKDHKFKFGINALVAEENSTLLGGGQVGVWIHTQPVNGLFWSWDKTKKWVPNYESELSKSLVLGKLTHRFTFDVEDTNFYSQTSRCLLNTISPSEREINNVSLNNIKKEFFKTFELEFDTRNYTKFNNFEYTDIIPINEQQFNITEQVHRDDTNYIIEVFFLPNNNSEKYLLINDISLQDVTQREQAGIGTGFGLETSGVPHRRFIQEDKIYLDKGHLRDVLQFYNGLMGQRAGVYTTPLASRDATISSGVLEVSGGSRLNYRMHPDWVNNTKDATFNNYTEVEFDN